MAATLTKEETNYRLAEGRERCGRCTMFLPKQMACTLVKGTIRPMDTCDRFVPKK